MNHVVSDWERSDNQNLGTYRMVMRTFLLGTIGLAVLLGLMALFLL